MAKTIRDTILAYPGLADCEDFLDNVVLPGRGFEGTEDSKTIDIQKQKLVAADLYSMVGGLPDFTENKLSITYPRAWYDATAKRLYREGGEPEKAELIGNKIEVPKGRARNRWKSDIHTAIVTIQTCQLVKGELVAGKPTEIEVTGQYYPSNSGQQLKRNVDGREFIVHGEFSTKARPVENAKHIRIDSIALDVDIISWEPFQTHSVIYV